MKHKVNLVWNAFRYDSSSKELVVFDVIRDDLITDIEKAHKKKELKNINDLKKIVKSWAMYHYWSKVEHEVIVTDMFSRTEEKIDVYWQIDMNLDRLCEYIAHEMQLFR